MDCDNKLTMMDREGIKFLASIVTALCLIILVPLQTWMLVKVVNHGERLAVVEKQFYDFRGLGPRYTFKDAEKDYGIVLNLLERQGKTVDDHEQRIRALESED